MSAALSTAFDLLPAPLDGHHIELPYASFATSRPDSFGSPNVIPAARFDNRALAPPILVKKRSNLATAHTSLESFPNTDFSEVRSSSETTAATIFSMYGEERIRAPMAEIRHRSRPTTLDKELSSVPPTNSLVAPSDVETSDAPNILLNVSSEEFQGTSSGVGLAVPQVESGLRPPSPRITISTQSTPATISRTSSQAYSVQAPDEDDDCYHVRATYATLDHEGVPGDGYDEGIERTRTRVVSSYSVQEGSQLSESGLTEKEEGVLKSLDRYGFYMVSEAHHDARLALLPALPLKKRLTHVRLASRSMSPSPPELRVPPKLREVPKDKEIERTDKWERMMRVSKRDDGGNVAAWTFDERKGRKLRSRLYKGVPDRWRGAAWWSVIESRLNWLDVPRSRLSVEQLQQRYFELINHPSTFDIQIDLDVPRTITGHVFFYTRYGLGQRSLFRVLHCFSLLCPDCGYVQGMGPIASTLLCYLQPERAYTCMVRLHDDYHMHSIFQPGFPGLLENLYVQERIMETMLPDVYASFRKNTISSTSYATKWYITLFANVVPFQTQIRIWDAFFYEGRDLMVAMAVSIIWVLKDHLASPDATFETILSLLSSYFVPQDENSMLAWIRHMLDDKKLRRDIDQWRSDWARLVEEGESGRALL